MDKRPCLNPRQKVHTLLIISELLLIVLLCINTSRGYSKYNYKTILICSEILTLKSILKNNSEIIHPILYIMDSKLK